jgi:hypothetical protein
MESSPANASPGCPGEGTLDRVVIRRGVADEPDAVQGEAFGGIEAAPEVEADGGERFESARKKAFATGFIERRFSGIDDFDLEAMPRDGNGGSKAGRACTDDQDVRSD